jgi:ketosteroid isomerase-like protein
LREARDIGAGGLAAEARHSAASFQGLLKSLAMKNALGCRVVVLAGLVLTVFSLGASKDRETAAVRLRMSEFLEAENRYDAKAVASMLDENFIYVGNDGKLTSRSEFVRLTNRDLNPLDVLEVTKVQVQVSGTTAIATGLIHEKGTVDGHRYELHGRTLATFVLEKGQWICLAIHD